MRSLTYLLTLVSFSHLSCACVGHVQYQPYGNWPSYNQTNITIAKLSRTAITNVRVFDGYTIQEPQTIVIDGSRIGSPSCDVQSTYDAGGRILIPGLFDSHVHPQSTQAMQDLTAYGVTTAVSMACHNYTLCAQLRQLPGLASFISAGYPAVCPGTSHATWGKTPADQLFYNKSEKAWVDAVFTNQSNFLKITAEQNGPSLESQQKLVAETHALGKQTMTHASELWTYQYAIDSKTDGIQHVPLGDNITTEMVQRIIAQAQTVTPTIYITQAAANNPTILVFLGMTASPNTDAANAVRDQARNNLKTLYEGGVTLLAGTDAVGQISSDIDLPFGLSLHQELVDFVEAGMSPAEALRAATIVPAHFHRQYDRGVIMPGMRADMILLNSNPLQNISNTLDIEKVWVGGREYPNVKKLSS